MGTAIATTAGPKSQTRGPDSWRKAATGCRLIARTSTTTKVAQRIGWRRGFLVARKIRRQPKKAARVTADQIRVVSNSFIATAQEALAKMADKDPKACRGNQQQGQKNPGHLRPELSLTNTRDVNRNEKRGQDKEESVRGFFN